MTSIMHRLIAPFAILLAAATALAQVQPQNGGVAPFEEPPTLRASEILKPEYLAGPHHKVRDAVPTYAGANWFTIDSDFGVFEAEGNVLLAQRVAEISAIARLKDISRTEQFGTALARAARLNRCGSRSPRARRAAACAPNV